jgi:transglutaminase superfamily protein/uncharacterized protein DUF4129
MTPRRRAWREVAPLLPYLWATIGVVEWFAGYETAALVAFVVTLVDQVVLLVLSERRHLRARDGVVATAFAALLVAFVAGPRSITFLVPVGIACCFVALGFLQHEKVRAKAARALRRGRLPPDDAETGWTRDRIALSLLIPFLLVAVLLVPIATWRFPLWWFAGESETAPTEPEQQESPPPNDATAQDTPQGFGGFADPGDLEVDPMSGAADGPPKGRMRIEVTPTAGGLTTGYQGALYLRGVPYVESRGVWRQDLAAAKPRADLDDGRADGWCDLGPRPSAADEMDLAVVQRGFQFSTTREVVLPCPPGTAAVKVPNLRAVPDGVVLAPPSGRTDKLQFDAVARRPASVRLPTAFSRAAPGAVASESIPRELAAGARTAGAGETTDLGRVRGILRWLRQRFARDEGAQNGTDAEGLRAFVATGRGTSIQFAQAAALMLREVGIPARVGTGFVLKTWDPDRDCYVGNAADWHAWVEANFAGTGWAVFEPTPGDLDDGEGASMAVPDVPEEPAPSLEDLLAGLRDALLGLANWILEHWWLLPLVAAAIAVWARRRQTVTARGAATVAAAHGAWERLLDELARQGHRRGRSQTASEFARAVVVAAGPQYQPLVALTARQQAARFGDRPFTAEDVRAVDSFRTSLEPVSVAAAAARA